MRSDGYERLKFKLGEYLLKEIERKNVLARRALEAT